MGFVSIKSGEKIKLSKGYESPAIGAPAKAEKEPDQEKRTAGTGLGAATPGTVGALVGGMGVGGFAPAPQVSGTSGKANRQQAMGGQGRVRKIREVYAELDRLNRQALDPAAHQNPTQMNRLNQEMKRLRASVGEQTLGDRVESGLGAIAASSAGSVANAAGLAAETAGEFVRAWEGVGDKEIARNRADMTRKILETGRLTDGRPVTPGMRPQLEEALARYEAEHAAAEPQKSFQERYPVLTKAKTGLYGFADRAGEDAARLTAEAKEGLGAAGQMAVDVGIAGGQMGLDVFTAALTGGSSLAPMAVRAAGGAAQEARQAGADLDRQIKYGLGSAALSVGTEKISNVAAPFRKMFGTGAAERIAGSLVKRFGENDAVQMMQRLSQTVGGRIALSAIGEGGEEVMEDVLQPFLKRATYDKDARFDAGEAGHDFLVGAILGGLGGTAEQVGRMTRQERAETGTREARTVGGDMDVPVAMARSQELQKSKNDSQETLNGPETAVQGGLDAGGDTVNVMAQEVIQGAHIVPGKTRQLQAIGPKTQPTAENTFLTEADLGDYLRVGERKHVRDLKAGQLRQGQSPILTGIEQVKDFIRSALSGTARDTIKAYGRVGSRMAGDIQTASGLDVSGYYLELDANRVRHLSDHITEDGDPRNIPLTSEQVEHLTDYIDTYDAVLDIAKRKDGSVRVTLGKRINGHAVIVELISRGRRSIHPVTAWQNTTEHYLKKYGKNKTQPIDASQLQKGAKHGYKPAVQEAAEAASVDSVSQSVLQVKAETNPLLQAILGDRKRVDQATLSPEQYDRAVELNEQGTVGMAAVPTQEVRRLYGDEKAVSLRGETAREYHGQIIDTIRENLDKVQGMRSVAQLTGGEFQKTAGDNRNLRQKVIDFFNSIGNKVHRPDMGDIELNAAGARSSVAHGYGKLKAATFAALPSVLEHGKIIEVNAPYEGHEYESFLISAPVDVNGTTCYVGALVIKDPNVQRYKLHEVLTTDENGVPLFKSETGENSDRRFRSDTPLDDVLLGGGRPPLSVASPGASSSTPSGDMSATSTDSSIAQGAEFVKQKELLTIPMLLNKEEAARRRILTDRGGSKPAEALHQEYLRQMQATAQKDILHNLAVTMLKNGVMPDSDVLAAMGITQEEAGVLMRVFQFAAEREELDRVYRRETGEELKRLYKRMIAPAESGEDWSGNGQDR